VWYVDTVDNLGLARINSGLLLLASSTGADSTLEVVILMFGRLVLRTDCSSD